MPEMSRVLKRLSTGLPYRIVAPRVILPWVLQGRLPRGSGLEIGAGSGAMGARLLRQSVELRLHVTDVDPDMLERAQRALSPFGSRAEVSRADAADLPFDDYQFDVVLSFGMLHHVPNRRRALSEAVRVLRPGGWLVGYDLLDTAMARSVHRAVETGPLTAYGQAEVEHELARLPLTQLACRAAAGRAVVRFSAWKAPK